MTTQKATSVNKARGLIMAAVDDSDPGRWAVSVAASFARVLGAEVVLVHVINPAACMCPDTAFVDAAEAARSRLLARADAALDRARTSIGPGVRVDQVVREGDAGPEIVAAAREWEADLLVVGTRGRSRLTNFILGSTAETVVREAHCPVVTIGHDPSPTVLGRGPGQAVAEPALSI
jgi:nucleotide-binding universal stress UspA family protein